MKKSKIIVPALAVLCLSTAAAVSGTVAWFASSRSGSFQTTNITVINPEGQLKYKLITGKNASASTDGLAVAFNSKTALRDASVAVTASGITVYRAIVSEGETGIPTSYVKVTDEGYQQGTNEAGTTIAYCATWDGEFWIDGANTEEYILFFDANGSSLTLPASTEENPVDNAVFNAYRVGMYTGTKMVVWAPNAVKTNGQVNYVSGLTTEDISQYTVADATKKVTETLPPTDTVRTTNELGSCWAQGSGHVGGYALTVHFVAWFEGSDPQCTADHLAALASKTCESTMAFIALQKANLAV